MKNIMFLVISSVLIFYTYKHEAKRCRLDRYYTGLLSNCYYRVDTKASPNYLSEIHEQAKEFKKQMERAGYDQAEIFDIDNKAMEEGIKQRNTDVVNKVQSQ